MKKVDNGSVSTLVRHLLRCPLILSYRCASAVPIHRKLQDSPNMQFKCTIVFKCALQVHLQFNFSIYEYFEPRLQNTRKCELNTKKTTNNVPCELHSNYEVSFFNVLYEYINAEEDNVECGVYKLPKSGH